MKYLIIILSLSFYSCTVFQKKQRLPGKAQNRLQCIQEMEHLSTEEAINVCKFINEENV